MSKFFNETLKALNGVLPTKDFNPTEVAESTQIASLPGESGFSDGGGRLAQCRKIVVPIAKLVREQFAGSDSLESADESYRALRTRLMRLRIDRGMRSIIVTSSVQGEGKTHISTNLAHCCAQLHEMRVLLIDGDIRSCGLSRALSLPPSPGLGEVLSGDSENDQAIVATDNPNLYLLSAGRAALPPAELFAGRRWQEFIQWCSESFNFVLVDAPPILNLADVELMTVACDGVVMVVRAQHTKREQLQKSASQVDAKKLLGLVYNAVENGSRYCYSHGTYGATAKS
jgi:polysaccharide biosynthesis transport protein